MKSTKYKHEKRKVKQTLHKVNERKKWVKQRDWKTGWVQ